MLALACFRREDTLKGGHQTPRTRRCENCWDWLRAACNAGLWTYTPRVIRNVIFDWSGTLVDDLPAVWEASNHVLRQAGVKEMSLEEFRAEFSLPFTRFYHRHVPHVALSQLEVWFHAAFRGVQDSVVPLPHGREFLEFCRRRGLRMFLLSTVHPDHFAVQVRTTGFGEFFEHPYVGIWDKREKIHDILLTHGLDPRETVFVGDMQHDIETARHGGVHSCAVLTGYNRLGQLREARPDLIVEHLGEFERVLERCDLAWPDAGSAPVPAAHPIATVGALIFNGACEVLMIRTRKWSNLWGIPGGKIEFGENSDDALRREVREETSLEIDRIEFVLVQDCVRSKEFYREAHFVLLNYTCQCVGSHDVTLNDEAEEWRWVSLDDAAGLALNHPTRVLLNRVRELRSTAALGERAISCYPNEIPA